MASSSSDQNRKTNKFGIVIRDEDQLDQFIEFFTEYHYMAVISPLHNEDHWTKTDIERFIRNNEEKHGIIVDRTAETFEVPGKKYKVVNGKRVRETITVRIPTVGMHKLDHRHAMIKLDYSALPSTMKADFAESGLPILYFEPIKSEVAYLQYFIHMNNPEKAQYNRADVISLGFNLEPIYRETEQQKLSSLEELHQIADAKGVQTVRQFAKVLRGMKRYDLVDKLRCQSNYWRQYLYRGPQVEKH